MTLGEAFIFSVLSYAFWSIVLTVVFGGWT